MCTHLASGDTEGDERNRNANAADLFARTSFPRGQSLNLPRKILDHEYVNFSYLFIYSLKRSKRTNY